MKNNLKDLMNAKEKLEGQEKTLRVRYEKV